MTQDEIIRMAQQAGIAHAAGIYMEHLERFSALVAAHEREKFYGKDKPEECANGCPKNQVCDYCQRAEQAEQEPVAIGSEWKPCMKLPVVVHVREQREGESHVSTREGITPVRPDDLIMRGVAGEEYPIGRELFNKTYTFDTAAPVRTKDLTDDEILEITKRFALGIAFPVDGVTTPEMFARAVIAADREKNK